MSELMLIEQFEGSAKEFADKGLNPDDGPYKDQPLKHEMWKTFYFSRLADKALEAA
jgi:hypothetical protein